MRTIGRVIFLFAIFTAFSALAQRSSNWRVFKAADGLAESFVTSVAIGQRSNVWVRHFDANGVSFLDGDRVKTVPTPDRGAFRVYESRSGQIWAAHVDGLQEYKNGVWVKYPVKEVRQEFLTNVTRHARSFPIVPLRQSQVLFLLTDQLLHFNNEWPPQAEISSLKHVNQTGLGKFSDMTLGRNGTLWIIGSHGLLRLHNSLRVASDSVWHEFLIDPALGVHDLQQAIADDTGGLTMVGNSKETGRKMIVHFDGKNWSVFSPKNHNIRQAWKTADDRFWAISINSLLRQEADGKFVEDREIPAFQFFDVASDANGVFWLATSEGLFRHAPSTWQQPVGLYPDLSSVRAIWEQNDGTVWIASADGLHMRSATNWNTFRLPEGIEQSFQPGEFLFTLPKGKLVMNLDGKLLCFDTRTKTFSTNGHPEGIPAQALGLLADGNLAVRIGSKYQPVRIEMFDGEHFATPPFDSPPLSSGVHLFSLFTRSSGEVWLGFDSGVLHMTNGNWPADNPEVSLPESALCFAELNNGKIWCGTRDRVWEFDGKMWTVLRSGFDRVNAIQQSRDGSIWVASNTGLFRFDQGNWSDQSEVDGLPANVITEIFEDRSGQIWAGTSRGAALYFPQADPDSPRSVVTKIQTDKEGSVTISFTGADKWKYTPADQLLFSYRLNERDWSPFQADKTVSFQELPAGTHYFQVRAKDRNWNIDPQPALLDFEVMLPWYQETRLVIISLAGLGIALFFAALAFNRHRSVLRSYAEVEQIVKLRTHQLEQANVQLLHSQKMTALGALAAGIAHDFNSILSIIKGSAQIIESNLSDREKIKVRAERIKTAVDQGSEVVKAMLGFSRPSENGSAACDLNQLVSETIRLLGDRFQRDLQVEFKPRPNLPQVFCSPNLIQQILLNFIFNASDAMDGKGKIEIRAAQMRILPENSVLRPDSAAEYIAISVCDDGCGIAPEVLPRIFEPFFTTKAFSSRRGTGLGLSMVYQLAKEMKCGLAVETQPGNGSTFMLILPVKSGKIPHSGDALAGAEIAKKLDEKNHS